MSTPVVLNPNHWANRGCQAWWANLPGQTIGSAWPDLLGRYPFTVTYSSGTENRNNGPWSPSGGSAAGILGTADARPGAYTKSFLGPLYDGTAKWYAQSNFNLANACPSAGTLSVWLRSNTATPIVAYEIISQGTSTTTGVFDLQLSSNAGTPIGYAGYYINAEYRASPSNFPSAYDTAKWHHYAITWAASDKCRLYVDGYLFSTASSNLPGSLPAMSGSFYLGYSPWSAGTYFAQSAYDDLAIWSRQMSAAEIWNVYQQSMAGWPGRAEVYSPSHIFLPPFDVPVADVGAVSASGGVTYGGKSEVDFRTASGGITQGGAADSRYVPYVATPPRIGVTLSPNHWANRGCQAWWSALPGLTSGLTWYDLMARYNLTAAYTSNVGSVASNRTRGCWSPSYDSGGTLAFTQRPGSLVGCGSFGPTWWAGGNVQLSNSAPSGLTLNTLFPNAAGTVSFWYCPTISVSDQGLSGRADSLFHQFNASSPFYPWFGFQNSNGTYYFGLYTPTDYRITGTASSFGFQQYTWYHLAFTFSPGNPGQLYINGLLSRTGGTNYPSSLPSFAGYGPVYVCSTTAAYMDDVGVWSYAMPAAQINALYRESIGGWFNRADISNPSRVFEPPFDLSLYAGTQNYVCSAQGGFNLGGYPTRTSTWIMPGIGGMTDGGAASAPAMAFGPAATGGMTDGGDTAAPLAWDTFTGSNGTLLTAHPSDDGGTWTEHPNWTGSATKINGSNQAAPTAGSMGVYYHSQVPASADYTVSCDCSSTTSGAAYVGVAARVNTSASTAYVAYGRANGTLYLDKYVSGTFTNLSTISGTGWTTSQTKRISLRVIGSSISVYWDGVLEIGPITDSSISSTGRAALMVQGVGVSLDNWMSTGGGVQARYAPDTSGGMELGGHYSSATVYVVPCSGGVSFGGVRTGPAMAFHPTAAGGMREGGVPAYGLSITIDAAGGTSDGGVATYSSGILVGGGMAIGGETAAPVMAFGPPATGGMTESGVAPNLGVFGIFPAGGMMYGGRVHTYAPPVYRVYVNDGAGGPINYGTIVAEVATLSYTTGTLAGPATWSYGVRTYDANVGLEELNLDAAVTVILDAAGNDITNIPAPPLTLTGHAGPSGSAVLSWHYQKSTNPTQWPTEFRVYQGVGSVSYSSPVATVPYYGLDLSTATVTGLTGGTAYMFGVRAANSTGEEPNTTSITITAETAGPAPVINLSAVAASV